MNKTVKQIALFMLIGLIILAITQVNQKKTDHKILNYSDFILQVKEKKIGKVIIENNKKIFGYYVGNKYINNNKTSTKESKAGESFDFWLTIPYADSKLIDLLVENNVKVVGRDSEENFWLKGLFSLLPWLLIFGFIWFIMIRQIQATGNKALSFGKSKAKLNADTNNKVTFDDVAGADEAKEELEEIIEFLKDPKKFINIGAKIPTGVLLMGPPGTGKTLLAKAIAGEADVPFFSISGSDFVEMFVGVGASRVRDLFEQGKKSAPCIVFIDEIDAVGRLRGAGLGGGHDEREQTLNQLLVEMDGFETNEGVIIIAATNRPDVLDPALLRPGRFDRQVMVDIPDVRGREKILAVHAKKIPLGRDVDLKIIARGTPGFTGADLANLINESALLAARYDKKKVSMTDLEMAKDKVLMGPERHSMLISENEKRIVAYHEAGHTIIGIVTGSDPIHKVTIIPRGRALGLTMQLPTEDKHLHSKNYWLSQIKVLFGGHLAEKIKFNELTTGSGNDIERASAIARKMVCEWGMSEKLGPITFGKSNEPIFLGREISQHRDYSEKTAQLIDEEVSKIVESCKKDAENKLIENIDKFNKIAEYLIERETLDNQEIGMIMRGEILPEINNNNVKSKPEKSKSKKSKTDTLKEVDVTE